MKYLISIVGTTGIGKTKLAIELAQFYATEILSCDSRQFFKEMAIGTAAPDEDELALAKHHFIGNLSVMDTYSIGQFETDAMLKLDELFTYKDVVIMVGGSMMYEKAVLEGLNDLPEANEDNQLKLKEIWEKEGLQNLQYLLQDLDPEYYEVVDKENPRRLLRAIDVIWQTKEKYSVLINKPKISRNFTIIRIGIEAPRDVIYQRINSRVDNMMVKGLLEEVKKLESTRADNPNLASLNTVGYTELFRFLSGEWDLDFAVSEIKKNSRRFAKRQLTWYRGDDDIHWVSYKNPMKESLSLLNNLKLKI